MHQPVSLHITDYSRIWWKVQITWWGWVSREGIFLFSSPHLSPFHLAEGSLFSCSLLYLLILIMLGYIFVSISIFISMSNSRQNLESKFWNIGWSQSYMSMTAARWMRAKTKDEVKTTLALLSRASWYQLQNKISGTNERCSLCFVSPIPGLIYKFPGVPILPMWKKKKRALRKNSNVSCRFIPTVCFSAIQRPHIFACFFRIVKTKKINRS